MAGKLPVEIEVTVFDHLSDLDADWQMLVGKAREISNKAHAPYSNFHVGAAVLLESGKVITGNNQENASYPNGLCAERTALFYIGAHHHADPILKIAVVAQPAGSGSFVPVSPCGGCRQVMSEYRGLQPQPIQLLMPAENGQFYLVDDVDHLLPFKFSRKLLG